MTELNQRFQDSTAFQKDMKLISNHFSVDVGPQEDRHLEFTQMQCDDTL